MATSEVLPRFEVEKLEGEVKAFRYVKTENGLEVTEVMEPAGYMVYLPNGNSLRVRDDKTLKYLGFNKRPGLAMMGEGEQTEDQEEGEDRPTLKQRVARVTQQPRHRASQQE